MQKTKLTVALPEHLRATDIESIKTLVDDLGAMGVRVKLLSSASDNLLAFEYNPQSHKRNAGRKRKGIPPGSPLQTMTPEEIDAWLLNNSIEDISKELGISRSTAFRRRGEAHNRFSYAIVPLRNEEPREGRA